MGYNGYGATGKEEGRGGGSSKWSGSSSGSGSAGEMKRYMQSYLRVIERLYGKMSFTAAQQRLANQAFAKRFDPTTYADMLRRHDPMYVKSQDYKDRVDTARQLYKQFRPGRVVPNEFVRAYAHSSMSKYRLQKRIESSKWFKREFAGWTEAQKAGSPAGYSPQTFINYRTMWNNALKRAYGRAATPLEQRMMFGAGMTGDEVYNNMMELFGGAEALKWATGTFLNRGDIIKGALTNKYGTGTLGNVRQKRATMAGYLSSENKQFGIGADEQGTLRVQGI